MSIDVSEVEIVKLSRWAESGAISEGLGKDYANALRELRRQLSEKEAEVQRAVLAGVKAMRMTSLDVVGPHSTAAYEALSRTEPEAIAAKVKP